MYTFSLLLLLSLDHVKLNYLSPVKMTDCRLTRIAKKRNRLATT